jgi:Ca-activated chloride channel family protein
MINHLGRAGWRGSLLLLAACLLLWSCRRAEERLEPRSVTWAELRAVRSGVLVTPPGEAERPTLPRERLADGTKIRLERDALAWLRRDGGATLLVRGPARLTLRARSLTLDEGRSIRRPARATTSSRPPAS